MGYCTNETLVLKEEGTPTRGLITITKDVLFPRTTGEDHPEDKEEETDNNTTPQTLPPP